MFLRGDAFTPAQKRINFEYYEKLTVRDSSLSACCQSVIAAEVGHLALAYDYLAEAALMDLDDLEHNTRDGLHMASLAGTWIALVAGLGGMRECGPTLKFAPKLPEGIGRLSFNLEFRGRRVHVDVTPSATTYALKQGAQIEFFHFEQAFSVSENQESVFNTPSDHAQRTTLSAPSQPYGREPTRRLAGSTKFEDQP